MLDRIFDLAKINDAINKFSPALNNKYHEYLINEFGVLFTYHSNRIEGANTTLTLNDTKNILNNTYDFSDVVDSNKQREINETINHQKAFKYIFEVINKEIDIILMIKKLHQIVDSGIIIGAGSFKERENYMVISSGKEVDFTSPDSVPMKMEELKEYYYGKWQELTVYERAIMLHMAVVNIHPFSDENELLVKNNDIPLKYLQNNCLLAI